LETNFLNFFVYVVRNREKGKSTTYVGYTNNLKRRLDSHNSGKGAKFTKGRHWKLIYSEKYKTKKEAMRREYYIKKNRKFRNFIKDFYK